MARVMFGKTLFNRFSTRYDIGFSVCSHSAADRPRVGSIRMSSGPRIKEKLRQHHRWWWKRRQDRGECQHLADKTRSATYSPSAERSVDDEKRDHHSSQRRYSRSRSIASKTPSSPSCERIRREDHRDQKSPINVDAIRY